LQRASSSQESGTEDDAMPEYEMPIEEQINVLVREFRSLRTRLDSVDSTLTAVERKIEGLRELMDERFTSASKTNAEHAGLLKSVVVHIRRPADRVEKRRR
jgi:hypothetical protein